MNELLKYTHIVPWASSMYEGNKTEKVSFDIDPIYLFTNPSTQAGYDTRSILKRSLTGLNSEFSFS